MDNGTGEQLHPKVLLAVSQWVDFRRWSTKWRIVAAVGREPGGDWLSVRDIGAELGVSHGRVAVVIRELERDRVLMRPAGGTGSGQSWRVLNPDVTAWRNVPWTIPDDELARRVRFHEELALHESTPEERFVCRARGYTRRNFASRVWADRRMIEDVRSRVGPGGARNGAPAGVPVQGQAARTPTASPVGPGPARNGADSPRRSSPPAGSVYPPPPPGVDPGPAGPGGGADAATIEQLRRLVLARSVAAGDGRKFLNGRPLDRLRELVAIYGPDVVREAAERVPKDQHRVPGFLEELAHLAGVVAQGELLPEVEDDDDIPAGMDLVALHDRADNLRRLIATCEQLGDHETAELRRSELLECENAIEANNGRIPA